MRIYENALPGYAKNNPSGTLIPHLIAKVATPAIISLKNSHILPIARLPPAESPVNTIREGFIPYI